MDIRKRNSKNQESKVAKELAGKVTPASGALWGAKADVRNDCFLVECKTTEKDFYSLTFTVWDKINKEAIKDGLRIPVMCIDLNNGKDRYAVMSVKDLQDKIFSSLPSLSNKSIKSFRVKQPCTAELYSQVNKPTMISGTYYKLAVFTWDTFLSDVVPYYS